MKVRLSPSIPDSLELSSLHPLASVPFYRLLEQSQVVGAESGWYPLYFHSEKSLLTSYLKTHSYGEYIFDWAWANFYQQHRVPYYPKLLHALPFTPVNAPKLLGESAEFESLMAASFEFYQRDEKISGEHYLFTEAKTNTFLERLGFITMETMQYHWSVRWENFEHFLSSLKKNRRKMIRKERNKVQSYGLEIQCWSGEDLDQQAMEQIYQLYLSTIDKKQSFAYLNQAFFLQLPKSLSRQLKVVVAKKNDELLAMALFFAGGETLYGRYWGIKPQYRDQYPALHFELCYYWGMDYCMEKNFRTFEAGAQGEHKLWRGFEPVAIYSCHHLKHPHFFQAVKDYVGQHNRDNSERIAELHHYLPYQL
jgi:predicted N-acyltransferase